MITLEDCVDFCGLTEEEVRFQEDVRVRQSRAAANIVNDHVANLSAAVLLRQQVLSECGCGGL